MPKIDWTALSATVGVIAAAIILAMFLQPQKLSLSGNAGFQAKPAGYRAGGSKCEPAAIAALPVSMRLPRADACADAEENHRYNANNLIQYRRAADAAEAAAVSAYQQTRIGTWGIGLGAITMLAAIGAAWYARDAAKQGRRGADAAEKSITEATRMGQAQARAYLACSAAKIGAFSRSKFMVVCQIRNFGQSPARNVQGKVVLNIFISKDANMDAVPASRAVIEHDIPVGTDEEFVFHEFNFEYTKAIKDALEAGIDALMTIEIYTNGYDVFDEPVSSKDKYTKLVTATSLNGFLEFERSGWHAVQQ